MIGRQVRCDLLHMGQRVGGLECRNNTLEARAELEGSERFGIGDRDILDPAAVVEPGVLGADTRIVQPGRNRMGVEDLSVVILQQIGPVAVQYAGLSAVQGSGVFTALDP